MKLINSPSFNGYPVMSEHGALVENILIGNDQILSQALHSHTRSAVMRFELKFPKGYSGDTEVISKFFDALRYRLRDDLVRKTESRGRTIHSDMGYVWVKELSGAHGWHYHVALFVNYDVYNSFGVINSENVNTYNRILASWASAMGSKVDAAIGLVHIPKDPVYKLWHGSETLIDDIHTILYRLSYLAKLETKPYGDGLGRRFFGTSRR